MDILLCLNLMHYLTCWILLLINGDWGFDMGQDGPDQNPNLKSRITNGQLDCPLQPLITPTVVHVSRPTEVENNRKDLPIVMMEQEIMEAINDHTAVIICGETGCGKTTQVPQVSFMFITMFLMNQDQIFQ